MRSRCCRWVSVSSIVAGCCWVGSLAQAQAPVTIGSTGQYVDAVTARSLGSRGVSYATPPFTAARRQARTANKYTVARPVYAGRPGVSFAGYSDYYFPRIIGARETVYTAAPQAPVEVGYRAFARPGTPIFPR